MIQPLLSICIPTYNRAYYLDMLLNFLLIDDFDKNLIQIVISNNSSTDETELIYKKYINVLPIKYVCQHTNVGASKNIIDVVDYADGTFCALAGDDDIFCKGWIQSLLVLLRNYDADIIISDRIICDFNLNPIEIEICGPVVEEPTIFSCSNLDTLEAYFLGTKSFCGFGYLSNLVVRKSSWSNAIEYRFFRDHFFPHTIKVIDICYTLGGRILKVPLPSVLARSGNGRIHLDEHKQSQFKIHNVHICGFLTIADMYFHSDYNLWKSFLNPAYELFSLKDFRSNFLLSATDDKSISEASSILNRLDIK